MIKELKAFQAEAMKKVAPQVLEYYAKFEVTTSWEVATLPGSEEATYGMFHEMEKSGDLSLRVRIAPIIQRDY
jgi:hypothetical protein